MISTIIKTTKFLFSSFKKNPYTVLGLSSGASDQDIKSAYYKLAKQYHPDVHPDSAQKFKQINEAYNVLKDPIKRTEYEPNRYNQQQYRQANHQREYQNYGTSEHFYYQQDFGAQRRYRKRPASRNYYTYNFEEMDQKRQYDFMRQAYFRQGFHEPSHPAYYRPGTFTQTILYMTFMLSIVILTGSMLFSFYAVSKSQKQRIIYEHLPADYFDEQQ